MGHARAEGDPEANLKLAEERSRAISDAILAKGISPNRIRTRSAPPLDQGGAAQSVTFDFVQAPY